MPISAAYNMNLTQTEDDFVLLLKNDFSSIYQYIYDVYGESEQNISLYHLLTALEAYWKKYESGETLKLTLSMNNIDNYVWSGMIKE